MKRQTTMKTMRTTGRVLAACALMTGFAVGLPAQDREPAADPADVETIDGIIAAVYGAISGPAGAPRQWDRFRSLMAPGARLIPTGTNPQGQTSHRVWTVEEYVAAAGPNLTANGFFEVEIGRVAERYGPVVHMMSAYASRRTDDPDEVPFQRGVNSFQLMFDGTRWWVVTIFWASETPDNPIPERLLGGGAR